MNEAIVLINPPSDNIIEEYDAPPYGHIGLAYLGSALKSKGFRCFVLDAKLGRMSREDVIKELERIRPGIVGITSHTHEINAAAGLAKKIKELNSEIKVIIGGIHASSLPADTIRNFECFDFLIKGEGEAPLIELCNAVLNEREGGIPQIAGLAYRKDRDVVMVPPSGWIEDLDSLGFPAWDLFPKMKIFPVISSRGCPYKCIFCARMLGDSVRVRSVANVLERAPK